MATKKTSSPRRGRPPLVETKDGVLHGRDQIMRFLGIRRTAYERLFYSQRAFRRVIHRDTEFGSIWAREVDLKPFAVAVKA